MSARAARAGDERRPTGSRRADAAAADPPRPDAVSARPAWQQLLLAAVLLWVVIACVLPEIALQRQIFTSPDYESPSYFGIAGRAAMAAGEYPLWNPLLFLGMPSFASLAFTPWVYPISEVLSALAKLPLAPPLLWLVFYLVAAGFGVFLLLRDRGCGFWPSLLGGAAFMLMPHLMSMGVFGHGSKLASVAYLPYLALLALHIRDGRRRPLWIGLFGLAFGLQLLRGHPQIAFYGGVLLGVFVVVEVVAGLRSRTPRGELVRFVGGVVAGGLLGAGIASVVLLPVKAYAPESIRGAAEGGGAEYQYATNWSFSPSEMATLWLPSAAGFGEGTYVGTMPFTNFPNYLGQASLLFGIAALLLLRGRLLAFAVALSVLALLVSFGRNAPVVYDLFYRYLPYFNRFRVPVMILVLQQLCAAIVLGLGSAALLGRLPHGFQWRRAPARREAARALFAAIAIAVATFLLVQPWSGALAAKVGANARLPPEARAVYAEVARHLLQADGLRVGFLLVASAVMVVLAWRRTVPVDVAGSLLVALTVIDLGVVDRKMVAPEHTWPGVPSRTAAARSLEPEATPLIQFLQKQPRDGAAPLRILPPGQGFMNNEWMAFGIASVGGYHPAKLARFEHLVNTDQRTLDPDLLDVFAVRYVVLAQRLQQTSLAPVYEGADGVVYENPRAMPRAWVTGAWEHTAPGAPCKARLLAADFDRSHVVLLESDPSPAPDPAATGQAQIRSFTANRVGLEVTASAPALVVLAEAYHSGWRAKVDGKPAPVLPADGVLRAVAVPSGTSRVEFEFVDPALGRGLVVSCVSLAIVLGLVGSTWLRERRRGTSGAVG